MKAKTDGKPTAHLDDMLGMLAELWRVKKKTAAQEKKQKQLMQQCLRFIAPDLITIQPNERVQHTRSLDATEHHNLKALIQLAPAYKAHQHRKKASAKGAIAGGKATAAKFARPDLDNLIRAFLARGERKMPVKALAEEFGVSDQTVYTHINRIKKPKPK